MILSQLASRQLNIILKTPWSSDLPFYNTFPHQNFAFISCFSHHAIFPSIHFSLHAIWQAWIFVFLFNKCGEHKEFCAVGLTHVDQLEWQYPWHGTGCRHLETQGHNLPSSPSWSSISSNFNKLHQKSCTHFWFPQCQESIYMTVM